MRGPEPLGERGVLGEPADVVAADDDDAADDDAVVQQPEDGVEEGGPLGGVHTRCPELLELVADQEDRGRRRRLAGEVARARRPDAGPGVTITGVHALAARQRAVREGRDQAGPHDRRLARRRSDPETTSRRHVDEPGHQSSATSRCRPWNSGASPAW